MMGETAVVATEDGQGFTIIIGAWSGTYPLDALPRQLAFYRLLAARKNGAYAQHYRLTVQALEEFARQQA